MTIKKRFTTNTIVLVTIIVLLLGGVVVAYMASRDNKDNKEGGNSHTSNFDQEQNKSDQDTSRATSTKENSKSSDSTTPPPSTEGGSVSIEILRAEQQDTNFVIQTAIKGAGSGICKLTISKGSYVISKQAEVLFQPSFSTCQGFAVPLSEFPDNGDWVLKIVLEVGGSQRAIVQKNIVINK